ncbi:hypothetical protein [Gluconobacter kondonii]|nr:hypothetical protein [Gluconobacter kondonii]
MSEDPDRLHLLYLTLQTLRDDMPVPDQLTESLKKRAIESWKRALDLRC